MPGTSQTQPQQTFSLRTRPSLPGWSCPSKMPRPSAPYVPVHRSRPRRASHGLTGSLWRRLKRRADRAGHALDKIIQCALCSTPYTFPPLPARAICTSGIGLKHVKAGLDEAASLKGIAGHARATENPRRHPRDCSQSISVTTADPCPRLAGKNGLIHDGSGGFCDCRSDPTGARSSRRCVSGAVYIGGWGVQQLVGD